MIFLLKSGKSSTNTPLRVTSTGFILSHRTVPSELDKIKLPGPTTSFTLSGERTIFLVSKTIYQEAHAAFLNTAMFDLRDCNKLHSCDAIKFLGQREELLSKTSRVLCYGGSTPKLLHALRTRLSLKTNVSNLREINLSYSFEDIYEVQPAHWRLECRRYLAIANSV